MAQLLLLLETAATMEFSGYDGLRINTSSRLHFRGFCSPSRHQMEVALRGRKIRGKRSRGSAAERGQGTGGRKEGGSKARARSTLEAWILVLFWVVLRGCLGSG
jgi:hypothetical protein